jgi:transketolase
MTQPTRPGRNVTGSCCPGHASMVLYGALHLAGYDVTLADIRSFRQLGSRCAGDPERGLLSGVEVTTGPLGQGVANAVGMAMAERLLAARFNTEGFRLVDHRTIAKCGDGAMMEGVASEACSLAGHLGLGELTLLYDDNRVSLLGVVFTVRKPDAPRSCHRTCPGSRWRRLARSAGRSWTDQMVGLTTFGASGKGPDLYRDFGLTPEVVAAVARQAIGRHPSARRAAQEHR